MTSPLWPQVESICSAAMERDGCERGTFLDAACEGDERLRREVDSLLAYEYGARDFLERPALEHAAKISVGDGDLEWQIAGYQILSLLGAGGMGDVYRARDVRLEREVALKVLARPSTTRTSSDRFEEEARAASVLNHPNIVTIYGVGTDGDVAYIAMELVRGRTLRAQMADAAPSLTATLDVAVQLADALSAAHAAGLVHRDLKPENVMVTPEGLAKILDFGIAKRERGRAIAAPSEETSGMPAGATDNGAVLGTAGYMSPEQAMGAPVAHSSDQFSFGAILYELLCGRRAFERPTKAATADAIIHEAPEPLCLRDPRAPTELRRVVERCLNKDPRLRYAGTRELAADLRRIRDEWHGGVRQSSMSRRRALWLASGAALTAAAGLTAWRIGPHVSARRRLAVLPFANPLNDDNAEYLCDGIVEVVIRQLARMPALSVTARSTVFQFKGKAGNAGEIGRRLNVDAVLSGAVTRRGGRALITAELIDVASGARLWGDVLDRPEADVLAIRDEIGAAIIGDGLRLPLTDADRRHMAGGLTSDPSAFQLFLRAVHQLRLETEDGYRGARELLIAAVARDSGFALGQLTLASTYSVMAVDGYEPPHTAWPQSRLAVNRALEQDPALPEAHAERASEAFFYRWDWATARQEWDAALQSRRGELQAEMLNDYVLQQWALGHHNEALRFAEAARAADPLSAMLAVREADLLATTRQTDAAASLYTQVIRDMPDDQRAYAGLAEVRRGQGRFDEAIAIWRRAAAAAHEDALDPVLAAARGADGYRTVERAFAEREIEMLRTRSISGAYLSPLDLARAYARLDERERAFGYLDAAFDERASGLVFLNVDRAWDKIRGDARFAAAIRRVGLA